MPVSDRIRFQDSSFSRKSRYVAVGGKLLPGSAMRIESIGKTLVVSGLSVLNSGNAGSFRDNVRASVQPHHTRIDVDMSLTRAIDSTGLGALVSVHRFIASRQGQLRLINPVPVVKKVLDLTQLSKSFEITQG